MRLRISNDLNPVVSVAVALGTGKPQAEHRRVAAFAVGCVIWAQHIRDWLGYATITSVGNLDDAFPLIEGYEVVLRWVRDGDQHRCRHEVRPRSDAP